MPNTNKVLQRSGTDEETRTPKERAMSAGMPAFPEQAPSLVGATYVGAQVCS